MPAPNNHTDWFTFEIKVSAILCYIERQTGVPYAPDLQTGMECNKWHIALRDGLRTLLHLNLGIPGFEVPDHPIEENESALLAALLMGKSKLPVILSGEWELAVSEGLITRKQLRLHEQALSAALT